MPKLKLKSCKCKQCKARSGTKPWKRIKRSINRIIRSENRKICSEGTQAESEKEGYYEIDGSSFQGYRYK